jgi:hypothetical protein
LQAAPHISERIFQVSLRQASELCTPRAGAVAAQGPVEVGMRSWSGSHLAISQAPSPPGMHYSLSEALIGACEALEIEVIPRERSSHMGCMVMQILLWW